MRVLDGVAWYDSADEGPNSHCTNYGSPNATDWLELDFGAATTLGQLKLAFYDTGTGGVRLPSAYQVQYLDGGSWTDISGQQRSPATLFANDAVTVDFPPYDEPCARGVDPTSRVCGRRDRV